MATLRCHDGDVLCPAALAAQSALLTLYPTTNPVIPLPQCSAAQAQQLLSGNYSSDDMIPLLHTADFLGLNAIYQQLVVDIVLTRAHGAPPVDQSLLSIDQLADLDAEVKRQGYLCRPIVEDRIVEQRNISYWGRRLGYSPQRLLFVAGKFCSLQGSINPPPGSYLTLQESINKHRPQHPNSKYERQCYRDRHGDGLVVDFVYYCDVLIPFRIYNVQQQLEQTDWETDRHQPVPVTRQDDDYHLIANTHRIHYRGTIEQAVMYEHYIHSRRISRGKSESRYFLTERRTGRDVDVSTAFYVDPSGLLVFKSQQQSEPSIYLGHVTGTRQSSPAYVAPPNYCFIDCYRQGEALVVCAENRSTQHRIAVYLRSARTYDDLATIQRTPPLRWPQPN